MKYLVALACTAILCSSLIFAQSVAINGTGATANGSAMLDVASTTKGFLGPRMTQAQRTAIATPATGLLVYQTNGTTGFYYYNGTAWVRIGNGDGTVTSVATTAPLVGGTITTTGTLSITQSGTASDGYLSATDWNTFNAKVDGSGAATRVAFWNTATSLASDGNFYWDNTNNRLGVGVGAAPGYRLDVASTGRAINSATSSANNYAGVFTCTAAAGTGGGVGIYAQTGQSAGFASDSRNINTNGTGAFGLGNNAAGLYLVAGSGGAFNGVITGAYARSTTVGVGEGLYTDQFGAITRVNYWSGTTMYKIIGTGTVSTTADGLNGDKVTLHCTEGPEILFEDYGQGKLVNGRAHIDLDPIIAKNIVVSEAHPLRVYVQLEGECNGVYVTNKSTSSFDVVELAGGHSNTAFQYHIVGNRADEVLANGRVSKNADIRFEPAPLARETAEVKSLIVDEPTVAPGKE